MYNSTTASADHTHRLSADVRALRARPLHQLYQELLLEGFSVTENQKNLFGAAKIEAPPAQVGLIGDL